MNNSRRLSLWTHLALPTMLFVAVAATLETTSLDRSVADVFYDQAGGFWTHGKSLWANEILHILGRDLVAAFSATMLIVLLAGLFSARARAWRRPAGYVVLTLLLGSGTVALLKRTTNVDCPWDLEIYGGSRPAVRLFGDRPDDLPRGRCFPGGHSSGAFSLFSLYFLALDRQRRDREQRHRTPYRALLVLLGVLAVGTLFSFGQWVRGAHFPSHDLWSAMICYLAALGLYVGPFHHDLAPTR